MNDRFEGFDDEKVRHFSKARVLATIAFRKSRILFYERQSAAKCPTLQVKHRFETGTCMRCSGALVEPHFVRESIEIASSSSDRCREETGTGINCPYQEPDREHSHDGTRGVEHMGRRAHAFGVVA